MEFDILPGHYTLADVLGRDSYCLKQRCIDLRDEFEYMAKIYFLQHIPAKDLTVKELHNEVMLCRSLCHPNLVQIYDGFKIGSKYFLITDIVTGRKIADEILNKVSHGFIYSEAVASHYFYQLMAGVVYLHNHDIIHRDLTLENLILSSDDNAALLKIGDFEKAVELPDCSYLKTSAVGTKYYMSPEMLKEAEYGFLTDTWSCGVILHVLLGGSFPYENDEWIKMNECEDSMMTSKPWAMVSNNAKHLVHSLLLYNQEERYTAEQAFHHPWLKEMGRYAKKIHLAYTIADLKVFSAKCKARRLSWQSSLKRRSPVSSPKNGSIPIIQIMDASEEKKKDLHFKPDMLVDIATKLKTIKNATSAGNAIFLNCMLQNKKLKSLIKIHSLTQQINKTFSRSDLKATASEAIEVESELNQDDRSSRRLKDILRKPHIMALLRTHDDVITEWSGQQDDSWKANHVEQARDNLTRVRLVQFPKNKDEPLGVTLKLNDSKHCVVARVIHGSMAHRQGTLHVGDEIREVNGTDISNLPLEKIQQLLKNARGDISLKIVPSRRQNEIKQPKLYVRCLYDYDPEKDDLIPCQQAGLAFNCGDVLEIVSRSDNSWWQGIHQHRSDATGLIPSPELQEKRRVGNTEKIIETPTCLWPKNNKLKTKNGNYSARLNTKFDGLALLTYEEVVRKATFSRKTLVLLGAHGVGRRHIKNSLISRYSEKFAYPLPHTSRQPDPSEMNGQCWYFESETKMLAQITRHEFLEYGQHEGSLYGTKLSTIRNIISDGKIPVLDPETPTLKILRCKEFAPYIVFISSPQSFSHTGDTKMDASLQRLITESNDLESRYRHYFDYEIINNSIEETVEELVAHLHKIEHEPEWCPTSWMY